MSRIQYKTYLNSLNHFIATHHFRFLPHNILDKFYLKWSHIGKIKKINSGSKEEKLRIFRMHELNLTVDKGRNRFISSVQFHHLTTYGNVNMALRDRGYVRKI